MALQSTQFEFIGTDREVVAIKNADQYLDIARNMGQPNYKQARIPVKSGINLGAWEIRLSSYPDKRLFQYLKFGFPLSITDAVELGNKNINNHFFS